MPLHTCAPPRGSEPMSLWVCPECGATWESAPGNDVFDFDRDQVVTRAEWLLVEGPAQLAG